MKRWVWNLIGVLMVVVFLIGAIILGFVVG